ncbi:MAG: hypothetical protein EZS28_008549 [Streblomastix strix]|uniref:B30.2/SPRY domain-containing protein n=1 Tax=Streblomastix strix TaxID=222440 RepID=A0A5J4WNE1_9EUKA|nr:MAG: hypothetical protein EZS28_008549 [Streblomastix strix]
MKSKSTPGLPQPSVSPFSNQYNTLHNLPKFEIKPISYSPIGSQLDVIRSESDTFVHTEKNGNPSVVLFNPVIERGVVRIEIKNIKLLLAVGIADESVCYGRNEFPERAGKSKIVQFWNEGWIGHMGDDRIEGNDKFLEPKSAVALELNMDFNPRTLTFFVNDKKQKNFIAYIPPAVRFWAFLWGKGASFKIKGFETHSYTMVTHREGQSIVWEYGKEWKREEKKKNCEIQ